MSADIPSSMPLSDLLKSTGFNCPEAMQNMTFDEATSGGDTKISTNTEATVDVSTYTEPVEIEPAEGYDATKKVTLTLENIPTGGSMSQTRPAWTNLGESDIDISGDVVVPEGVKVYYYNSVDYYISSFVGDGITTLSGEFTGYTDKSFVFIASCGDDISMVFYGDQAEEG